MKKKKVLAIFIILVAIGVAATFFKRHYDTSGNSADHLRIYGNVDIRQVQLAFQTTGRIEELLVREGASVSKGQLLARLDPVRYEAAVRQAKAQAAAQKELLARLKAGSRPEEIKAAQAGVRAAEASLMDAKLVYERTKELAQTETVPRQGLDSARAAFLLARAKLDQSRQELSLAVQGPRQEDIQAAQAQLEALEALLALREQDLADTCLYAPNDGVIQNRILEPGDMASPQIPIYTLALTNPVWVRAYIPEPSLGQISEGLHAQVMTDSFPGKVYDGWIGYISPTAEFTPKQIETPDLRTRLVYQVRVYVCNPMNQLRLGMPASVTIPLNQSKDDYQNETSNCGSEG